MKVYAAMWCSCIYESDYSPLSLHRTKPGAFKALLKYRYDKWVADRESQLLYGFSSEFSPTYQESWTIKEFNIKD